MPVKCAADRGSSAGKLFQAGHHFIVGIEDDRPFARPAMLLSSFDFTCWLLDSAPDQKPVHGEAGDESENAWRSAS